MAYPEELPDDLVVEICQRLQCRLDRAAMAATCSSWRASLTNGNRHTTGLLRQLPMLFFPRTKPPSFSCLSCGGGLHRVTTLPDAITGARLIGSRQGGWWFAATGFNERNLLYNIRTGQQIQVPDTMKKTGLGGTRTTRVQILAATLSATPGVEVPPPADQCYGAALVMDDWIMVTHDVMFWRCDQQIGLSSHNAEYDAARTAADVIFHDGAFKFLTRSEELFCVVMPRIMDDDAELNNAHFWAPMVNLPPSTQDEPDEDHIARYLVVSRDDLLMVRRYVNQNLYTYSFKVYRLIKREGEDDHFQWDELQELDGRILFLATGSSISYDVQDFTDYPEAMACVYFKGDFERLNGDWLEMDHERRRDMMGDCGRWWPNDPEEGCDHCFATPKQVRRPLEHSAPIWLVP